MTKEHIITKQLYLHISLGLVSCRFHRWEEICTCSFFSPLLSSTHYTESLWDLWELLTGPELIHHSPSQHRSYWTLLFPRCHCKLLHKFHFCRHPLFPSIVLYACFQVSQSLGLKVTHSTVNTTLCNFGPQVVKNKTTCILQLNIALIVIQLCSSADECGLMAPMIEDIKSEWMNK